MTPNEHVFSMIRLALTVVAATSIFAGMATAHRDVCLKPRLADFSSLGSRIKTLNAGQESDLLSVRLLFHESNVCRLAYEIQMLLPDGRIDIITLAAETLTEISISDRDSWSEFDDGISPHDENHDHDHHD